MDLKDYEEYYIEYEEYYRVAKKFSAQYWKVAEGYISELNWLYIGAGIFVILFGLYLFDSMTENQGQGKTLVYLGIGLIIVWTGVIFVFGGIKA